MGSNREWEWQIGEAGKWIKKELTRLFKRRWSKTRHRNSSRSKVARVSLAALWIFLPDQFLSIELEILAPTLNENCGINHFDWFCLEISHRCFSIVRSNYRWWESVNSVRSRCYYSAYIMHRVSVDRRFTHRFKKDGPLTQIKEGHLSPFEP